MDFFSAGRLAAFGFGVHVANTVGKGVVTPAIVDQWVILAGLTGAIAWDLITWWFGLPTSSSHALIFSIIGASVAIHGLEQAGKELGGLVTDVKLPEIGQTPTGSYEGEGYILLRHPETEVVKQALQRLISVVRVELG